MALINGTNGDDTLIGTNEADTIFGSNGDDSLQGLEGDDLLYGGNGQDQLWGGDGKDTLEGGNGDDRLYTSYGYDDLTGGNGNDVFVLSIGIGGPTSGGTNHITDFEQGTDLIELPQGLAFQRVSISNGTGHHANDAVITDKVNSQPLAIVVGIDSSEIKRSDFIGADRDVVLDWNATALEAVKSAGLLPPVATRNLAMVHTAIYDAVNAIEQTGSNYYVKDVVAPQGASREAAVAAAAHDVLVSLFPTQKATFDAAVTSSLAEIPDGKSEDDGVTLGKSVAEEIIAWRSADELRLIPPGLSYTPGTEAGNYQLTPPSFSLPHFQQWANITPWTMTSASQFRPDGPAALDSDEYVAEFNQMKDLGRKDSATRTADQTEIALFWTDPQGTYLPAGHFNQIAEQAALSRGNTLSENARLFAQLNTAAADSLIATWDAKVHYDSWRPITAIPQADTDGNPLTSSDSTWESLIVTPSFQDYVSAHSAVGGATSAVLASFFGDDFSFTTVTPGLSGVSRSYDTFSQAGLDLSYSRLYGGVHFQSSVDDGFTMGQDVGNYAAQNFFV